MDTTVDTTVNFQTTLKTWRHQQGRQVLTDQELAELIYSASHAKTASGSEWGELQDLLVSRGNLKKDAAAKEVKRCRKMADLGTVPHDPEEFVRAWIKARGYAMDFHGEFCKGGAQCGLSRVHDELNIWTDEHKAWKQTYESALNIWIEEERLAIMRRTFNDLAFDPAGDPDQSELKRFVRLITATDPDPIIMERNYKAAEVALSNFIWRVKNHIGAFCNIKRPDGSSRWAHYAHVMPVLFGKQEYGKTLAVRALLSTLGKLTTGSGFEILEDNSKQYQLSFMPVMSFDELAGLKNANVEKLKGIMTEEIKTLREVYRSASPKTLVTTFIGCTNECINGLINDKSGNRRFYQITVKKMDPKVLLGIDARKIWKSINENDATAPLYGDAESVAAVREVQAEERHKSPVQWWVEDGENIPTERSKASDLFPFFMDYARMYFPNQVNSWDAAKFGKELTRLANERHAQLDSVTKPQGTSRYRILPNSQQKNVITLKERLRGSLRG